MLKKTLKLILTGLILATVVFNANAAENRCINISGTALGEATDESHFFSVQSGSFSSAYAKVLEMKKTETGPVIEMEHYWINEKGGVLKTHDHAVLTPVVGKDQLFMIEITVNVVESRGDLAGYKGSFNSVGLTNMADGKLVVRHSGQLCK
jgi:hypothetical protein